MSYYNEEICENCVSCSDISYGKGYCSYYRQYVDTGDSCSNYSERSSGSGGCFLTTACCEYMNLPDDCDELQAMRNFRDNYLSKTNEGKKIIEFYYHRAPGIVNRIENSISKEKILNYIYHQILECIELQKQHRYEEVIMKYGLMMYNVDLMSLNQIDNI